MNFERVVWPIFLSLASYTLLLNIMTLKIRSNIYLVAHAYAQIFLLVTHAYVQIFVLVTHAYVQIFLLVIHEKYNYEVIILRENEKNPSF